MDVAVWYFVAMCQFSHVDPKNLKSNSFSWVGPYTLGPHLLHHFSHRHHSTTCVEFSEFLKSNDLVSEYLEVAYIIFVGEHSTKKQPLFLFLYNRFCFTEWNSIFYMPGRIWQVGIILTTISTTFARSIKHPPTRRTNWDLKMEAARRRWHGSWKPIMTSSVH